ncbi:MAG TPA: glycosyltransferase [Pyrinomonadaceae bacterium]|jgi:glycosyltransferase involved in cell wall biosynthesis|nr:glycosyltransferase [Pyrinomonadaceae bacterium]
MNLSVIIPVRNEEDSIRPLLDALLSQTMKPAEIVISDNGSTDRSAEIISEYVQSGAPVLLIRCEQGLPGRGRNLAAAKASHEWLAFIDAGVRPEPNWLEALSSVIQSKESVDVVYGSYEPVTNTFFKECAAIAFVPALENIEGHPMRTRSIASALMRRSAWEAAGGFPEDLRSAEDLLFMDRVEALGNRISFAPGAVVHWDIQPTLWKTFRRFFIYSHNNIRAGLWRSWQATILRRYAALAIVAVLALLVGLKWLWVPLGLWFLMMIARTAVAVRKNSTAYPASNSRNFLRFIFVLPVLATIDLAALAGCIKWLLTDRTFTDYSSNAVA